MTPAALLAAAAKMGWIVIDPKAGFGAFSGGSAHSQHLTLVSGSAPGSIEWVITDTMQKGFAPFLFPRDTHNLMHNGTLREDGSINHEGCPHRVSLWYGGLRFIAEAVTC
jgi:hypothetical protein